MRVMPLSSGVDLGGGLGDVGALEEESAKGWGRDDEGPASCSRPEAARPPDLDIHDELVVWDKANAVWGSFRSTLVAEAPHSGLMLAATDDCINFNIIIEVIDDSLFFLTASHVSVRMSRCVCVCV